MGKNDWFAREIEDLGKLCDIDYQNQKALHTLAFRHPGIRYIPPSPNNTKYSFMFNGEEYLTGSIVRITDEAKEMMGSEKNEVVLTDVAFCNGLWWHSFKYQKRNIYEWGGFESKECATPYPIENFVTEVIAPKTIGIIERETQGINAPSYKEGKPVKVPDEDPAGTVKNWLMYIGIMVGAMIFKDWYMKLIVWIIATVVYTLYRNLYKEAHTVYIHDEDVEFNRKVHETLYEK